MKVERSLQINMAVLVTLSTVLLAMGQQNLVFPLLVSCAAVTSVYFTDTVGWFRLNRVVANGAAIIGVMLSLKGYLQFDGTSNLLAVANLLICLQIILLYQQKSIRTYWYLLVLSLLQVVVASALNMGLVFGALLVVYGATAVSALVLFFVHRETARFEMGAKHKLTAAEDRRLKAPEDSPDSAGRLASSSASMAYQECKQDALVRSMLNGRIVGHVATVAVTTLVFTVVFFYSTPRQSSSSWHSAGSRRFMTTGVADNVDLSTNNQIYENDELVMRIAFFDGTSRKPRMVNGDLYFRGVVLVNYRARRSTWNSVYTSEDPTTNPLQRVASVENVMRQEIVIEPHGRSMLFGVFPVVGLEDTPKAVRLNPNTGGLIYQSTGFRSTGDSRLHKPFRYVIGTTAIQNGVQSKVMAYAKSLDGPRDDVSLRQEQDRLTRFDSDRFTNLTSLARQVVRDEQIDLHDRVAVAEALERHFLSGGGYSYSLDLGIVPRDDNLDKIEDFVTNHRTGHCEYFAGALTLMLRSQGIPARMVVGYKGAEFNSVGRYYQVRQYHAHAWVEVYIESDQAEDLLGPEQDSSAGAWLRLDPTPMSGADASGDPDLWSTVDDTMEYAQLLWSDYVVGLDYERQQHSIFNPLAGGTLLTPDAETARQWRISLRQAGSSLGSMISEFRWSYWLSWRGVLLVIVALLVMAGVRRLARYTWTRRRRVRARFDRRSQRASHVDFYERLVRLLERAGIRRAFNQTQREFATIAASRLADVPDSGEIVALPQQIVEAFYRVRFGGAELGNDEIDAIERALSHLQDMLTRDRRPRWSLAKTT